MGLGPAPKAAKKKSKHRGFFGSIGHAIGGTSRGIYHGVTGFPTGVYMTGRALGHDLAHPDIHHPLGFGKHSHLGPIVKGMAKSEYDAYRHFGRGGDYSTPIFDALALLSGGGAVVGKAGAASRALRAGEGLTGANRAILRSYPHSRQIPGQPYRIPASPNPLMRGIQVAALKNPKIAGRALERRNWQAERFQRQLTQGTKTVPYKGKVQLPPGVKVAAHQVKNKPNRKSPLWQKTLDAPMDALRLAMWARPRYYAQNITQTGQMLGTNPFAASKAVGRMSKVRKSNTGLYKDLQNITGEGQALASQAGRVSRSRAMEWAGKTANAPEAHIRVISIMKELDREGFKTEKQMVRAMKELKSGKPSSRALNAAIRANENVGDFGRLSKTERQFMKAQIPIFYPMFKALTRYGYRFPFEHSIQAAAIQKVGKSGKAEQKRLLGDLPFWAQYLVPKGAGDPNAKKGPRQAVFNPGNIYNLQPGTDITRQAFEAPTRKGGPIPGINLLQEIAPAIQLGYGMETGKDIQTGYPIKGPTKRAGIDIPLNFLASLPLSDLVAISRGQPPTHVRSYFPPSTWRRIALELGPGPWAVSRDLKTKETTKQAKREKRVGMGRKKRKHKAPNF